MKTLLTDALKKALTELGFHYEDTIHLEHPADLSHGDYASNIALAMKDQGDPRTIADAIADKLSSYRIEGVDDISIAGPGFINISFTPSFFAGHTERALKKDTHYGRHESLKGKHVLLEYTDPNLFKEFHIGHLMPNVIGEALSRLYEAGGAEVKRANYQGDVGLHVAKALWGMKEIGDQMPSEGDSIESKASFMGRAYAFGAQAYEESEHARHAIRELNIRIYKKTDEELNNLYQWGRKVSLEYFESMYARLGTTFDYYFFESQTAPLGVQHVRSHMGKVFEESEGAYVYKGEKVGLHTRVFLNSDGLPTYEAKELGLAFLKEEKYESDISVVITAREQEEYFKVLLAVLHIIAPAIEKKTTHLSHGMMRLSSGKMSSRTGDIIRAKDLLDDLYGVVYERIQDHDMAKEEKHTIAERVSLAAVKYSILKQGIGRDIVFDTEKALSLEGDSGPYLQYTYVRTQGIVAKAAEAHIKPDPEKKGSAVYAPERLLYRFEEVCATALADHAPQQLVVYLTELASSFNTFYGEEKIVDVSDKDASYKLALTQAVGVVLKNGMHILGFDAPERM